MFEKLVSFTKSVSMLSDKPSMGATELKAQFDAAPDEVRVFLNKLIDALKKTESGDSGAKNIGATTIAGVTGGDVQSVLEGLKKYVDDYKKDVGNIVTGATGTLSFAQNGFRDIVCTYPAGTFELPPIFTYSILNVDTDGAYTMAHSITENGKDSTTIRVKNKGTATQYIIVYWRATTKK